MSRALSILALLIAAAGPAGAAPAAGWTVYADCAAAYQVNARLADPDRPAAMTQQISEVAGDYAAAARTRYAHGARAAKAAVAKAVAARIEREAARLSGQPREGVERIIDACPQLDG